jgi:DNA-binding beta-propeller fold protein YncE
VESAPNVSQVLTLDVRHAIVSSDSSSELLTLRLDGEPSSTAIGGIPGNPSRSAASTLGTAAAFYYSDIQQVRIVKGLPREPQDAGGLQLDRPLTQLAVSDDGMMLVYAIREGDGETLHAWTVSSGSPRFLTSAASVSGIAMTRTGDAIVTDRGTNEVFAIWDPAGGAVRKLLADSNDGVSDPTGVGVSSANRLYAANAGSSTLMVFEASGRLLKVLSCNCAMAGVYLLRDSVFRLTEGIAQTMFLLDASSAEERILFVPPPLD